jgi:hypothetical protein
MVIHQEQRPEIYRSCTTEEPLVGTLLSIINFISVLNDCHILSIFWWVSFLKVDPNSAISFWCIDLKCIINYKLIYNNKNSFIFKFTENQIIVCNCLLCLRWHKFATTPSVHLYKFCILVMFKLATQNSCMQIKY